MDGPKNDGISLEVVTGVFRSPVCDSDVGCVSSADDEFSTIVVPPTLVVNRLRCG